MAIYTILVPAGSRPGDRDAIEHARAIKGGFRFFAFFLPLIFTLYHRTWRPFLVLLALTATLGVLGARDLVPETTIVLLNLLISLYAGVAASDWIVAARERQKLAVMGCVAGAGEDDAVARFAHHWMSGQVTPPIASSVAASVQQRAAQGPVIGLFPESGGR